MLGKYLAAEARDAAAVSKMSRAITAWDSLLSVKYTHGVSLYDGVRTCYGLSIGTASTLSFRDRRQQVRPGDAVVMPPAIRVQASPAAELLWVCYEGLAPESLRGPLAPQRGFEHFALTRPAGSRSVCGPRTEVLPASDLRYRVHYHFVEIEDAQPHAHTDMVELYYVLDGEGEVRIGQSVDQMTPLPVRSGNLLAVGPGVYHAASNGLGVCVWFLYNEMAHRRRIREAAAP